MSQADAPPLEARGLGLRRGAASILTDISVRIRPALVTGVVGPSGAGKTSLLRCFNRLEEASEGQVLLDGDDVRSWEPTALRRRVGMIFQTPVLFPGDVASNLRYGLDGVADEDLGLALERAGLPRDFLAREGNSLSAGQAQRVCIARALVRSPEVLLMDEPTSALDRDAAARIEELVRMLADSGLTVVIVTHDLGQAERVATDAVLLTEGRVQVTGTPAEVARRWPGDEQ